MAARTGHQSPRRRRPLLLSAARPCANACWMRSMQEKDRSMTQRTAPPVGEAKSDSKYQPGPKPAAVQELRPVPLELNAGMRAARETVLENSSWVRPLQQEIGRVIVGQQHLLDRLLIALLTNGHVLLEGVPGLAKTLALKTLASCVAVRFQAAAVHPRHAARRHRRHHDLQPAGRAVPHQARPHLQQPDSRRRNQPRPGQGAKRAARGHAGAPGHPRRRDLRRCRTRSSCWRPRTRWSRRAPTRCPRRRSIAS